MSSELCWLGYRMRKTVEHQVIFSLFISPLQWNEEVCILTFICLATKVHIFPGYLCLLMRPVEGEQCTQIQDPF